MVHLNEHERWLKFDNSRKLLVALELIDKKSIIYEMASQIPLEQFRAIIDLILHLHGYDKYIDEEY